LQYYFRVIGERGQVLGEGRDLRDLCERFAPQARDVLRSAALPQGFRSSGITHWDFEELPKQITQRVHGSDVPVFPALVDQGSAAGIQLVETSEAAERAHLAGVRRLLRIACKSTLSSLEKRMPAPLSQRSGFPPSRAEQAAFTETVRDRVTAEAFALAPGAELPRTRTDFQRLLAAGTPRLFPTFDTLLKLLAAVRTELDKTLRALDAARTPRGDTPASADVRQQLERLVPPHLLLHTDLGRLAQLPRYLTAAHARLTRAIHDPRKDASKAEPLAPVLRAFAAKYPTATDREAAQRILFWLEELRVATFAPELRPDRAPSIAEAARAVAGLT
jgi:ATP-dependent RNA helicase HrpA